ncbi:unnamed protein product [Cyprideis torosa]|uniref:Uncharacterized protein n=1 Tax=Cyprideis torosa TaxID=163714 RepID=A0A7R8ZNH4_9CRUS|nr:unnamed protein product [Cyprideis torosa]CAG0887810.1 unnamed protein product [Cyprideis torosa]
MNEDRRATLPARTMKQRNVRPCNEQWSLKQRSSSTESRFSQISVQFRIQTERPINGPPMAAELESPWVLNPTTFKKAAMFQRPAAAPWLPEHKGQEQNSALVGHQPPLATSCSDTKTVTSRFDRSRDTVSVPSSAVARAIPCQLIVHLLHGSRGLLPTAAPTWTDFQDESRRIAMRLVILSLGSLVVVSTILAKTGVKYFIMLLG